MRRKKLTPGYSTALSTSRHQIFSTKSGGKLVGDGLPKMLTGDIFYERVVEFTKWQQEQEKQKAERRVDTAGYKLELAAWKEKEKVRKIKNKERSEVFHVSSRNLGQNWGLS